MLGSKSKFAEESYNGNFVGMDFLPEIDLTGQFPENWRDFNKKHIPVYMEMREGKSKIVAGLACGALWTLGKGMNEGDIVLCPNGEGSYYVGEIIGEYSYHKDTNLPHRRDVKWYSLMIERSLMTDALKNSTGSGGTISDISKHEAEIKNFIY